jgi:hypothetical protein
VYLVVPPGGCFLETRRIELGAGALTIGRAPSCEIRVDVPGVDEEHAKISEVALIALGPDCAIGDVPLDQGARRLLMPGDEIQIGSVVVALEGTDPSLAPPPLDANAATLRMDSATPMDGPRVHVVEGTNFGDELLLEEEGRAYVVGRGPTCDLVLDDREVSREHVLVMRKGYVIFVQDPSSTRGSWLGRSTVYSGATVEWSRPRMLRVGATVLALQVPEAIRRAAPAAQTSAPMTPPPRRRRNLPAPAPSSPSVAEPSSRAPAVGPSSQVVTPPASTPALAASEEAAAAPTGPLTYEVTPPPPPKVVPIDTGSAPVSSVSYKKPPSPPMVPPEAVFTPRGPGALPPASASRTAWKKSGLTIGRASGLLLLALAGLVILGGLFVVFSLLE